MANNLDINKTIGDVKKLNEELKKTASLIGGIVTNQQKLSGELSKTKGLADLNKKQNQVKTTQNEIEKQGNKLLGQRNDLIAAQDKTLRTLTKDVIKERLEKKKLNDAIKEEITGEKRANEIKKLRIAASKRAAEAAKKETKGITNLIQELRKSIRTEKDATDQNKKLLEVRKKLDTTTEKGRKQISLINKTIDKNNKLLKNNASELGKRKIGIGNYGKATEKTNKLIETLTSTTGSMGNAIGSSIESVKGLGKQFTKLLLNPVVALIAAVTAAVAVLSKALLNNKDVMDRWSDATQAGKDAWDSFSYSLTSGRKNIYKTWKNLDEIARVAKSGAKYIRELSRETLIYSAELERNTQLTEMLKAQSDDATLSFQKRQESAEKAIEIERENLKENKRLTLLAYTAIVEQLTNKYQLEGTVNERIAKLREIAKDDELEKLIELQKAYESSRLNQERAEIEYRKRLRDLRLDDFEQELDFILDVADKRKTANEKLIADQNLTAQERYNIFNETKKLLQESFDVQVELFESENELQIDRNKLLTLNNKESFAYARGLGLSERATNRLLEVIRERIAATSDLDEAQKGLNESIKKQRTEETKINTDVLKKYDTLGKAKLTLTKDITAKRLKELQAEADKEIEIERQKQEARKQILTEFVNSSQEIGNTLFDLGQAQRDRELSEIQNNYNARIAAAEGDSELQTKLAEELAEKQKQLNIEQARSEKNQALFNIAINTAQGIAKTIAQTGLPAALPFIALTTATGLAQAALVQAQSIPGFFTGTEDAPSGLKWVAEKGSELVNMPTGESMLFEKPTIINTPGGEEILNHQDTIKAMNGALMNDIAINGNKGIEDRLDNITRAFKNQPKEVTIFDDEGIKRHLMSNNGKVTYLNSKGRK
ncbi:hypothetical protein RPMD05_83 [Rhodobacteraceae phage LS06-2018-MD05]|nr:hypothetical protein RPMD05_83 [Rhodobacteraceae phage LS06-2018-MD05]